MATFGIIGAGTWGVALANMLSNMKHDVYVWSFDITEIDKLNKYRKHKRLDCEINKDIIFSGDLEYVIKDKEFIIFATPSTAVRETAKLAKPFLNNKQILITVSKGIEKDTMFTMSEILNDVIGQDFHVVALSGPTHAEEVAIGLPTLIVSSCKDSRVAKLVRDTISNDVLRVYSNTDIKGVELAGALKNIIALAAGMSQGMGFGDNATAALVTRGLTEITRLGKAMQCHRSTFYGLTGIGDIVVTATSKHSRNHNAGFLLGQGRSLEETLKEIGMVVEGINALEAAKELSNKYDIEMPIVNAVYSVIYENKSPKKAVNELFNRETTDE